jgi:ribonuclease P protein component
MNTPFTPGKKERLKSRKLINELFEKGKKLQSKSFGVRYVVKGKVPPGEELQVGVTVSTRIFPASIHRNRVKRLLREAWRLNKSGLREKMKDQGQLLIFFIYTSNEIREFSVLEKEMQTIIGKLENLLSP